MKILSFVGTTENAVLVQIWTAAITVSADVSTKMFKALMELLKPRQVHSVESHDIERSDGMA